MAKIDARMVFHQEKRRRPFFPFADFFRADAARPDDVVRALPAVRGAVFFVDVVRAALREREVPLLRVSATCVSSIVSFKYERLTPAT